MNDLISWQLVFSVFIILILLTNSLFLIETGGTSRTNRKTWSLTKTNHVVIDLIPQFSKSIEYRHLTKKNSQECLMVMSMIEMLNEFAREFSCRRVSDQVDKKYDRHYLDSSSIFQISATDLE